MTKCEFLAKVDSYLRPVVTAVLPPKKCIGFYSKHKRRFLKSLVEETPEQVSVPDELAITCWGLTFRSPIFNASGMFKYAEGSELMYRQGAGGYLAGTSTNEPREGNRKIGIYLPFAPYPKAHAASNWMGLPNEGHQVVATKLAQIKRHENFPVGISVMAASDAPMEESVRNLVAGMHALRDVGGVDFIEMNESCPNVSEHSDDDDALRRRLEIVSRDFLSARNSNKPCPVIVKFSNDTPHQKVAPLLEMLVSLGFDGVNFGNTSTQYERYKSLLSSSESRLYKYYSKTFGGGVSGRPLKERSLKLITLSREALISLNPSREFHLLRTGGVENALDVRRSFEEGASLVQWYTGYFSQFARAGHGAYKRLYEELGEELGYEQ